jgi:ribosomal protein S12 methylthiotransferase
VNLIAQDLSAYGRDLGLNEGLAQLLYRLGRVSRIERIRCFYLYPNTLTDAAIEAMARVETVCKYVDMPLQHADADVLRRMRRARDTDALRRIVGRVRDKLGDPVVRTAFITGFPGETDAAFDRLLGFLEEVRFDHVAAFRYSHEEGSAAAELDGLVPRHVAEFRRDRLLSLQEPIAEERRGRWIGRRVPVLVCGKDEEGAWYGRTEGQAPEIDGVTWLDGDVSNLQGRIVEVVVSGSDSEDLYAEPVARARDFSRVGC